MPRVASDIVVNVGASPSWLTPSPPAVARPVGRLIACRSSRCLPLHSRLPLLPPPPRVVIVNYIFTYNNIAGKRAASQRDLIEGFLLIVTGSRCPRHEPPVASLRTDENACTVCLCHGRGNSSRLQRVLQRPFVAAYTVSLSSSRALCSCVRCSCGLSAERRENESFSRLCG